MNVRRIAEIQRELAELDARRAELSKELADEFARAAAPARRRRPVKPIALCEVTDEEINDVEARMAQRLRRSS